MAAPRREQQLGRIRPRRLGGGSRHEHIVPLVLAEGGHLCRRQGADGDGSTGGSAVASRPVDPLDMTLAAITSLIPWAKPMRHWVRQKALRAVVQRWLMMCSR